MKLLKYIVDRVGSLVGLVLSSPLLAAAALAIRWTMHVPPLFRQPRAGIQGRPFTVYKLRTMTEARDSAGVLLPEEQRLTALGKFLRQTSVDELPQFLNVLRGEMSLVGPRPLYLHYLPRYDAFQRRRLEVRPGLTGWAQVHGRNAISWEEKFKLDVWYVDHWSLWLDLRILALTAWKVVARSGISQASHPTMPEFQGTPAADRHS